jgi:uncharacterized membrane protein YbaN (DUF454 family)
VNIFKSILIFLGTLSLCIGIIGIVVPGLPTTPFLLLTAGLYVRSSDRLYEKLISNRFVGPYILEFRRKKGMNLKSKLFAIIIMWTMITMSCVFFIKLLQVQLLVIAIGVIGTVVMGFIIPTIKEN